MIGPLEALINYLKADAALNALVSGRIASKHQYGSGWPLGSKSVQLQYDGGAPDIDTNRQWLRIEARCYGETQYECGKVWKRMVELTRASSRKVVSTGDGQALIDYLVMASGPSFLRDPDVDMDMILVFLSASVCEEAVI